MGRRGCVDTTAARRCQSPTALRIRRSRRWERPERRIPTTAVADRVAADERGRLDLGLYICRELIHRLGGTIGLDSEPGVATPDAITLPARGKGLGDFRTRGQAAVDCGDTRTSIGGAPRALPSARPEREEAMATGTVEWF